MYIYKKWNFGDASLVLYKCFNAKGNFSNCMYIVFKNTLSAKCFQFHWTYMVGNWKSVLNNGVDDG